MSNKYKLYWTPHDIGENCMEDKQEWGNYPTQAGMEAALRAAMIVFPEEQFTTSHDEEAK